MLDHQRALQRAANDGDVAAVNRALADGADANGVVDQSNETALHKAAAHGHDGVLAALLAAHATPDSACRLGQTPLFYAASCGHASAVNILIKAGAKMDVISDSGDSALHRAIRNSHRDVVDVLLRAGASPHALSREVESPVMLATRLNWIDVVYKLLVAGADPDHYVQVGDNTALMMAMKRGFLDIAEVLIAYGADVNIQRKYSTRTVMSDAVASGSVLLVAKLLAAGANVDHIDGYYSTPLIHAATDGYVRIVQLLIDAGADVNIKTDDEAQHTALIVAARKGFAAIVELLLQVDGIEVNVVASDSTTALLCAAGTTTCVGTVEKLVAVGANVHHVNEDGQTALRYAAQLGKVETVAYLLHLGLSADHADRTGRTPLHWASVGGQAEVVEFLLTNTNVAIDCEDNDSDTALSIAATHGRVIVVDVLLAWGASIQHVVRDGVIVCERSDPNLAARLMAAGADLYQ